MIKIVLIDVDNTLLDFRKCADESMLWCAEKFGFTFPEGYLDVFFSVNDPLWRKIEKGELTREGLYKIRWNMIFEKLGIDADGPLFEDMFRDRIKSSVVAVDGALEILKYLKEKYIVCVASNAIFAQQKMRLEKAGMTDYIEKYFTSEKIGFPKPTREFFEACLNDFPDIKKEEVIIIGDSISADIKGGHDFGFKTCWYNHTLLPHTSCTCADFVADSLIEIKKFL